MLFTYCDGNPHTFVAIIVVAIVLALTIRTLGGLTIQPLIRKFQAFLHREGEMLHSPVANRYGRNYHEITTICEYMGQAHWQATVAIIVSAALAAVLMLWELIILPPATTFWLGLTMVPVYVALWFLAITFVVHVHYHLLVLWYIFVYWRAEHPRR